MKTKRLILIFTLLLIATWVLPTIVVANSKDVAVHSKTKISNSSTGNNNLISDISHAKYNATDLVKKSLSLIGKNYPETTNYMNAFYKEEIMQNNSCITVNEALLNIQKSSYLSTKADLASIAQVRGNCSPNVQDNFLVKLQGGPISALKLDVIKEPFLGSYKHNIEESYTFQYSTPITLEDNEYYIVDFKQNPTETRTLYRGKIFIEKKSLAIAKIVYSMNVENRIDSYSRFFAKQPKGRDVKMISANYMVNYREYNGKWYFDYSTSNISFHSINRLDNSYDIYNINSQIAVTNLIAQNFTIDKSNILKSSDNLTDKIKDSNSSSDWDIYNLILLIASQE